VALFSGHSVNSLLVALLSRNVKPTFKNKNLVKKSERLNLHSALYIYGKLLISKMLGYGLFQAFIEDVFIFSLLVYVAH